jgi:hypothetical protein
LVAAFVTAVVAQADVLPPGSIRALPATAGAPSSLRVSASFDQPAGAELQDYNVDIARGFIVDPRAAAERCTPRQARSTSCPASSRIGGGTGQVSVGSTSHTRVSVPITFYLMRPQRPGDIAGLVLAVRQGGIGFALLGRLVHVRHGIYGLELRFANTARELPAGIQVQLRRVHVGFGTQRTVRLGHGKATKVTYHLLKNPSSCPCGGWPFLLTVGYSTGNERYTGRAACKAAK